MKERSEEVGLFQTTVTIKEREVQVAETHHLTQVTFQMVAPTVEVGNVGRKNDFHRKYNVFTFG